MTKIWVVITEELEPDWVIVSGAFTTKEKADVFINSNNDPRQAYQEPQEVELL